MKCQDLFSMKNTKVIVQTIHMKCQLIFFEKYKKKIYKQFHMKCKDLFPMKSKKKKKGFKMPPAAVGVVAFRVNLMIIVS